MNTIRVDPLRLREAGRAFKDLALSARRLAHDALRVTESAPSYDGDFGPRVRSGGAEVYAEHELLARLAEEAADFLLTKADEFEAADRAGQAGMAAIGTQLHRWNEAFEALLESGRTLSAPAPAYAFHQLSLEDFEAMTVDERIAWVRAFNEQHGGGFFFSFVDVLHYFKDSQIFHALDGSTPASEWMSWGDAGVLLVVQDGYLLFRDPSTQLSALPDATPAELADARRSAAQLWEEFFHHMQRYPDDIDGLRRRWSVAEQAGIDYATSLADLQIERGGLALSARDHQSIDTFVRYGNVYRWAVPTEHAASILGEVPGEVGEAAGQSLGQGVEDLAQRAVGQVADQVEEVFGSQVGEFARRTADNLVGEDSPLGALDQVAGSAGEWIGNRAENALEEQLTELGQGMFDPRLHLGASIEAQMPFGPLSLQGEVRGPVYYLSMAIEALLLQGNEGTASLVLDRLEQIRAQVEGQAP